MSRRLYIGNVVQWYAGEVCICPALRSCCFAIEAHFCAVLGGCKSAWVSSAAHARRCLRLHSRDLAFSRQKPYMSWGVVGRTLGPAPGNRM